MTATVSLWWEGRKLLSYEIANLKPNYGGASSALLWPYPQRSPEMILKDHRRRRDSRTSFSFLLFLFFFF